MRLLRYSQLRNVWQVWKAWRWFRAISWPTWLIPMLFWALLSAAVVGAWWSLPFPYTHDAENHLARFMNTAAAIRQGQFPPRFAPDVASGYGFPVLHYNYPLANLLAVPFVWLKLHPATIFALQVWVALSIGSLATWELCRKRFSHVASFAATMMFLTSSSLISMILYRGTIGEVWAYCLVPIILWLTSRWVERSSIARWWAVVLAVTCFGLAHNVLLVMFAPWVAGAVFWMAWRARKLPGLILAGLTSIGFTLWFWIPAVWELSLVVLQNDKLATQAYLHTLDWSQIWWSPLHFGFSFRGPLDTLGFGLGFPAAVLCCFALAAGLQAWKHRKFFSWYWVWVVSAVVVSLFFTSHLSIPLWENVEFLLLFQFPWRWLALTSLALVPLTAGVLHKIPSKSWWAAGILLLILVHATWVLSLSRADGVGQAASYYRMFPNTTTTRNENRPRGLTETVLPAWKPEPTVPTENASIQISSWNGSRRRYTVTPNSGNAEPITIIEPTIFFAGWQVRSDGTPVALKPELAGGLVAYQLESRSEPYIIESSFSARTPARWVGEGLSVLSLVASVTGTVWFWKKQSHRKSS